MSAKIRTACINPDGGDEGEVTLNIVEFWSMTGASPDGDHHLSAVVGMTTAGDPVIHIIGEHVNARQARRHAEKWADRLNGQLETGEPLKFPPMVEVSPEVRRGIAEGFMAEYAREAIRALMAEAGAATAH